MNQDRNTPVSIALLTVSDTRKSDTDSSGRWLAEAVQVAGHRLLDRRIVTDDAARIGETVSAWIDDPAIQIIITTGGTGITGRDITPDTVAQLFERPIEGFGELFRMLSYQDIGAATIQSRALGGIARGTLVFCLPGSTGACQLGWDKILAPQLDSRTRPCNFVMLLPRLVE